VQFPNPHDELFPGMYVRARIKQGIDSDAIAVPQQAIQRTDDGRAEVWIVRADETVMRQPVEVGPVVGQNWLIRSGLKAGERVIIDGFQKITVGAKVKPLDQTPVHGETGPKHDTDEAPDVPGDKAEVTPRAAAVQQRH
jgi:membrane fusion protein, multidrug efflux system